MVSHILLNLIPTYNCVSLLSRIWISIPFLIYIHHNLSLKNYKNYKARHTLQCFYFITISSKLQWQVTIANCLVLHHVLDTWMGLLSTAFTLIHILHAKFSHKIHKRKKCPLDTTLIFNHLQQPFRQFYPEVSYE